MTIDEAIAHCLEVAEQWEERANTPYKCEDSELQDNACRECAADHRQLAEWLTELKELREENKVLISECDRLIKEKGELLSKVSGGDVLRICQLEEQLEKAKELLKLAVEDMNSNNICFDINACNVCAEKNCISCDTFHWRYTDEALKLIGGRTDEEP